MLSVSTTQTPRGLVVALVGEIAIGTANTLEIELMRLSALRPHAVVFDMAGVTFVASLGMGLLVGCAKGVARSGGALRLAALRPEIKMSFERARLGDLMPIDDTVEHALAKFAPSTTTVTAPAH